MGWHIWIDRGGTFTDVVARAPDGTLHVRKLLSESREQYPDAPLHAIQQLLATTPGTTIHSIKMGTTVATNALLERKGARVGLLTTRGFRDLPAIGNQDRPDLFALDIRKPIPLATEVIEIDERVMADGSVRTPLDESCVRDALDRFRAIGIESIAVLYLHSYTNPAHEARTGAIAREAGFTHISLSHEVAREIKAVGRGDTTTADAYLTPILRRYIAKLEQGLAADAPLFFMQSHGGLARAKDFSGKNAILSGPAGGVVACAHIAQQAGLSKVIGFDMGGTSTDVSRYDGAYERVFETVVAGVRVKAPMLHIKTVAAGGGSILGVDSGRMIVGPESAGANPGPACYRRGGPATVTDANAVLGRVQSAHFPTCFGRDGTDALDVVASRNRIVELSDMIAATSEHRMSPEEAAAGFIRIANENMARPIRELSMSRGYDVREYALVCFGGAGGQHACALAEMLGITKILLHPLAGVLSAYGMGLADISHVSSEAVLDVLDQSTLSRVEARCQELTRANESRLLSDPFDMVSIEHHCSVDLRYLGVDAFLNLPLHALETTLSTFNAEHLALFGFTKPEHPVEIVALRVESVGKTRRHTEQPATCNARVLTANDATEVASVHFDVLDSQGLRKTAALRTPVFVRGNLSAGMQLQGPALIVEPTSTIVVDPGWHASIDGHGCIHLEHRPACLLGESIGTVREPVMLEIFNNLFMSIAEQMGKTLERISHSVNIKERLDFSCAVFDENGELVANAPHIPVHLGAMSESVKALLSARNGRMQVGDVFATNDPYHGGSHLPDVTIVTPVFGTQSTPMFYVANRGHHADIGGILPGSMPPFSKSIEEEGVVLHNVTLVSSGRFHEAEIRALLGSGRYPARNIDERISDLNAQIASATLVVLLLHELCAKYGESTVSAYTRHVRENASECMRARIAQLPDGVHTFEDHLDSGATIRCAITINGEFARIDFTGASPQLDGNLNAPPAVVLAAVLYVFRTLIGKPIPLNGGCMEPITVEIPEGSLLHPRYPAAVVGGNVETSMRIVDVLYGALGVLGAGQGTMNNLTFGTESWGYYETICGGAGAGDGFDGASAVHTHMTNTRITDPEVLERRYPVLLRTFAIRRGSGGAGRWRGGDGAIRTIEFLAPMSVAMLSERRNTPPYGVDGGELGVCGENTIERNGVTEPLPGHFAITVAPGDRLTINTPGGGGFGRVTPGPSQSG